MLDKSLKEFASDVENLVIGAVVNDDFVKIHTDKGAAVLVSEAEWDIMVDYFHILLNS